MNFRTKNTASLCTFHNKSESQPPCPSASPVSPHLQRDNRPMTVTVWLLPDNGLQKKTEHTEDFFSYSAARLSLIAEQDPLLSARPSRCVWLYRASAPYIANNHCKVNPGYPLTFRALTSFLIIICNSYAKMEVHLQNQSIRNSVMAIKIRKIWRNCAPQLFGDCQGR